MAWYSRRGPQLTRQILADGFMAVWSIVWFAVGRVVDSSIRAIATPLRATADAAAGSAAQIREAAEKAAEIPGIGDAVRRPFDEAAAPLESLADTAGQQVAALEATATVVGLMAFAVPFLVLLAVWLPSRLAFVRASADGRQLAATREGQDLLALRALAHQPLRRLSRAGDNPVHGWRAGDPATVRTLSQLELRRLGLSESAVVGQDQLPSDSSRQDGT